MGVCCISRILPYLPYLGAIYCRMNATRYEVRGLGCHKKTPNSVELGVLQKSQKTPLEAQSLALRAYPKNPFKMTSYLYSSAIGCYRLRFQISQNLLFG
jgi:hypothetical protein